MISYLLRSIDGQRLKHLGRSFLTLILGLAILTGILNPISAKAVTISGEYSSMAGPAIRSVQLNLADYPGRNIPAYGKLEITFQVDTRADNKQLPYDPRPPAGIQPGIGVTVNALFSPDNWKTVYTQPAFYYQVFDDAVKSQREWFYPTGQYAWKIRFTPNIAGTWQFKLFAQDASGTSVTLPQSFKVTQPITTPKGFIRVSTRDPRYFEFQDGTYFPGLGYNMNYNHVSWESPVLDNQANFRIMSANGIQLVRIWLSEWDIYGSAWNPWHSIIPSQHGQYIPFTGLTSEQAFPGSDFSMRIDAGYNPCMVVGLFQPRPAVKANTTYRVRIRYKTAGLQGPQAAGKPFGLVAKTGDWLWGNGNDCNAPGTGKVVTPYQAGNTNDWQVLEGSLNTGQNDFLPNFYLALENVSAGAAYIDSVWIQEVLGNGNLGPNILPKPSMAHQFYFDQRASYAFDKVLTLAEQNNIYLRPVIMEKNDPIFNHLDFQGQAIPDDPRCEEGKQIPPGLECPGNAWFYGNGREMTKVRWLQQAWWRYLQARWGYSTHIHSWELLNEGDPWSEAHYILADEFGKYMHQFAPDDHLVSTSFWHSFPRSEFWANPRYSHLDFADIHAYIPDTDPGIVDTAEVTYALSMQYGALEPGGVRKPLIRGETGFGSPTDQFKGDRTGVWLHNFIWGQINPGGMLESYWYENVHIYQPLPDGGYAFDFRPQFRAFYNFIQHIPLNNGHYQDAQAEVSNPALRAWGQKDLTYGRAHLWIQNTDHTWKNVVNSVSIPGISGTVKLAGFQAGKTYLLQWWDPYQPDPARQILKTESLQAAGDGALIIPITGLKTDIALQIMKAGD